MCIHLVMTCLVDSGTQHGSAQGRNPEQPQLLGGSAAEIQNHRGTTSRIDRVIGHRNTDQMDQGQTNADVNGNILG